MSFTEAPRKGRALPGGPPGVLQAAGACVAVVSVAAGAAALAAHGPQAPGAWLPALASFAAGACGTVMGCAGAAWGRGRARARLAAAGPRAGPGDRAACLAAEARLGYVRLALLASVFGAMPVALAVAAAPWALPGMVEWPPSVLLPVGFYGLVLGHAAGLAAYGLAGGRRRAGAPRRAVGGSCWDP